MKKLKHIHDTPGPFLRAQPSKSIRPTGLEACIFRLFGEKVITEDSGVRLTCYWWRGACYVAKEEKCSE